MKHGICLTAIRRLHAELCFENSAVATAELQNSENQIEIFHTLSISNIPDFPVEDFFKVPFTHHSAIISGPKETSARFYYIHRTVEEHLSVKKLRQLIKEDAYHSQGRMPNNFTRTINNPRDSEHQEFHHDLWQRLCFHRQPIPFGNLWC